MKIIVASLIVLVGFASTAQTIPNNAIGLRLGDSNGFGTEITYQRRLSEDNRLELDLGLRKGSRFNAWRATGMYQWVEPLFTERLNWFVGLGAGAGTFNFDNDFIGDRDNTLFVQAVGNAGVEYHFDFPLQIAADFRPEIGIINEVDDTLEYEFALSLRYTF